VQFSGFPSKFLGRLGMRGVRGIGKVDNLAFSMV